MSAPVDHEEPGLTTDQIAYRVLFVCTANICRSAYAEVTARARVPQGIAFSSAGTYALAGQPMDPAMVALTKDHQGARRHRAQQISRDHVSQADLVVAMASEHRRFVLDEWPEQSRKVFVIGHVARELSRIPAEVTLAGLVDHLWQHRTATPDDGVPDPYGRGNAAFQEAAQTIDHYLSAILGSVSST